MHFRFRRLFEAIHRAAAYANVQQKPKIFNGKRGKRRRTTACQTKQV
jgi:hypothetical protein